MGEVLSLDVAIGPVDSWENLTEGQRGFVLVDS